MTHSNRETTVFDPALIDEAMRRLLTLGSLATDDRWVMVSQDQASRYRAVVSRWHGPVGLSRLRLTQKGARDLRRALG